MVRIRLLSAALAGVLLAGLALAGDGPSPLATAHGIVDKVGKDDLTVRPRGPDGQFQKSLTLKLTGTSKLTVVTMQKRAGKLVPVQNDIAAKDLESKQAIAVIYLPDKKGGVLLSAVAQPAKAP
jgi:hypothetical protein